MNSQKKQKISAKKKNQKIDRICQGDIFQNIEIIEKFVIEKSQITIQKIKFPYVVCLNQECDLDNDFKCEINKDKKLLHLAVAPIFLLDQFLNGTQWGKIYTDCPTYTPNKSPIEFIKKNENPRYHYLKFPETEIPEFIIDFKHFFTINRDYLYENIENRFCSLDNLFKEKLSQRFSYFISRIGLPEEIESNDSEN